MQAPQEFIDEIFTFQCEEDLEEGYNELTGLAGCDGSTDTRIFDIRLDENENNIVMVR